MKTKLFKMASKNTIIDFYGSHYKPDSDAVQALWVRLGKNKVPKGTRWNRSSYSTFLNQSRKIEFQYVMAARCDPNRSFEGEVSALPCHKFVKENLFLVGILGQNFARRNIVWRTIKEPLKNASIATQLFYARLWLPCMARSDCGSS